MRFFQIFDGFIDQDSLDNLRLPVCELVIEPVDVVSVGNVVTIGFHSDASVSGRGFKLEYKLCEIKHNYF